MCLCKTCGNHFRKSNGYQGKKPKCTKCRDLESYLEEQDRRDLSEKCRQCCNYWNMHVPAEEGSVYCRACNDEFWRGIGF